MRDMNNPANGGRGDALHPSTADIVVEADEAASRAR